MTQAQLHALALEEDDISRWLDVENLFTKEDDVFPDFDSDHGRKQAPQDRGPVLPTSPGSDAWEFEAAPQGGTNTGSSSKRRRSEMPPASSGELKPGFSFMCFPSDPAKPEGNKKKRRDFTQERRLEVAQVRREGACLRCKIRRISCGQGQPCSACVKAAGQLGQQICSRERLTKIRFETMDINYIEVTTRLLDQELVAGTTHVSPPRKLNVSLDYLDTPKLKIEAQDYYTDDNSEWLCCWTMMNPVDGRLDLFQQQSSRYALNRFPTPESLIKWAEDITTYHEKRLVGLHQAMDSFIMRYSKSKHDLPMKPLVQRIHQLNCLAKVRLGLVLCLGEDDSTMPPSCALHTQFCLISKTASQSLEKNILSELEKVVFGASGIGRFNGLALWASLWCLILMYRKLVRSYVAFRRFPCHVPKEYSGFPETKLRMGTNFYHYMVSIYAALFRTTTPLYTDFRDHTNRELLGSDENLIEAFMNLRTESFYFQRESPRMESPEDQLLRSMVIEREARLRPRVKSQR